MQANVTGESRKNSVHKNFIKATQLHRNEAAKKRTHQRCQKDIARDKIYWECAAKAKRRGKRGGRRLDSSEFVELEENNDRLHQ